VQLAAISCGYKLPAARNAAVTEPLGNAECEQQPSERNTGQRHNQGEPAAICVGAGGSESSQKRYEQDACEDARAEDGRAPFEQLESAVIGPADIGIPNLAPGAASQR